MKEFSYVITDLEGIHARPAGMLIKEAGKFSSSLKITKSGRSADAKKMFAVMGLAAKKGETVRVIADGPDEDNAIASLKKFFKQYL
nr:HPr family phosphocarrier protein [uncultured Caproiciproducens sp.]